MFFDKPINRSINTFIVFAILIGLLAAVYLIHTDSGVQDAVSENTRLQGIDIGTYLDYDDQVRISSAYPVFQDSALTALCEQYVQEMAAQFREDLVLSTDGQAELNVQFTPYAAGDRYLSVVFTCLQTYGAGAPMQTQETLLIDTVARTTLALPDLFDSDSSFLTTLSTYCRQTLQHQGNPDKVASATVASVRSFSSFVLLDDTLRILFDSHEVADASGEPFSVDVPIAALKEQMRDDIQKNLQKTQNVFAPVSTPTPAPSTSPKSFFEGLLPTPTPDYSNHKLVALTFDDGPHRTYTQQVLDTLAEYDAVATFFVIGNRAEYYPELLQKIVAAGNEIGNHSYDHRCFTTLPMEEIKAQIEKTNDIIYQATGVTPAIIRPPYGVVSDAIAFEIGKPMIIWSVDPEDWKNHDSKAVSQYIVEHVKDGSIILMHDIYESSADAARLLIEELSKQGYQFVTVSQLMQIQSERGEDISLIFPQ